MARLRGSDRARSERGSVTVWLATAAFVMILLVGLVVDLTGQVHAQQHARDVAAQAARAGGQVLNAQVVVGRPGQLDTAQAAAAARTYLAASDVTGTVSIENGTTVRVTTSAQYATRFLNLIGLQSVTVHGNSEAHTVRALQGEPR